MARSSPRNYELGNTGIMRFTSNRIYKKRALYRRMKKGLKALVDDAIDGKNKQGKKTRYIEKPIGGDKNGKTRKVLVNRMPRSYPTQENPKKLKRSNKNCFSQHKRNLRESITPGTVLILVAGVHKGKRVVFLKQLGTGLLLVTGPFQINACPLRRINQRFVIATSTKVDISGVKIPDKLNDSYFKRQKARKMKHGEGEIFDQEKKEYKVTEERKSDQRDVDKQVIEAIRKNPDGKLLLKYLASQFFLQNKTYPHKMKF